MKKTILTLVITLFLATTVFVSCKPATQEEVEAAENVEEAKQDVEEAREDLAEAKKEANTAEWEAFKKSGDSIIAINDARIAALKLKMKSTGKSIDVKYQNNIDALEQKNQNLKVKIKDYKNDVDADWKSFKNEFNHDINEIGDALRDLTVDNKK